MPEDREDLQVRLGKLCIVIKSPPSKNAGHLPMLKNVLPEA